MASTPFTEVEMMILAKLSYSKIANQNFNTDGTAKTEVQLSSVLKRGDVRSALYKEFDDDVVDHLIGKVSEGDYKIVKAYEDSTLTGFAAIAIEGPKNGTVTVAARGTQPDTAQDLITDLQLGFSKETMQQRAMDYFMKDLDSYDSIYLTGHSLGGNLAVSGAVGFEDSSKIKGVYTFNAPGQNTEYIKANKKKIDKVKDKITNYQNEGDFISDINAPIGKVKVIKSRTGDSFDVGNNFKNHELGDMQYSASGFVIQGDGKYKHLGHVSTNVIISILTGLLSIGYSNRFDANIYDLISHGLLDAAIPNASTSDKVGVIDSIYIIPDSLRGEAAKLKLYQAEYNNSTEKLTNLIISLKQDHIWDTTATDLFVESYLELKIAFEKFGTALGEYATIMETVSNRMEETDRRLSSKIDGITL